MPTCSSASQTSIELVFGHVSQPRSAPATGAVCLGDTSDVDRSKGMLSDPESHTFGLPVVGSAQSPVAVVCICTVWLLYHLRGSARGHNYTVVCSRAHKNKDSRRCHHHCQFCHSLSALRT